LRVVTWLSELRGARVVRRYLVLKAPSAGAAVAAGGRPVKRFNMPVDETLVVRAMTEWVFTSNQGQPRRVPDEVIRLFRARPAHGHDANPAVGQSIPDPSGAPARDLA
jgi:acyl-CoA thioesterase FadM